MPISAAMSAHDVDQELDQIQKNQDELNARLQNSRNDTTPQINPSLLSVLKGQASASNRVFQEQSAATEYGPSTRHTWADCPYMDSFPEM